MATYKHESGKRFLFVHIPRTGGRFIEVNLEKNGWEMEPIDYYGIPHYQHSFIDDCEIAHFHRELYEKHCEVEDIEHIVVVRDPITRFLSASTYLFTLYGKESQQRQIHTCAVHGIHTLYKGKSEQGRFDSIRVHGQKYT